jgi:type IV pilus assembly protein PilY1
MRKLLLHAAFFSLASSLAYGDDTEIFTGLKSSEGGADILFIVDTSGSMATLEFQDGEDYNPETVYPGNNYNFDTDGHYIFHNDALQNPLEKLSSQNISLLKEYQVDINVYNCSRPDTIESVEEFGYATGKYAFYNPGQGWSGPGEALILDYNSLLKNDGPTVTVSSNTIIQCQESGGRRDRTYLYNGVSYNDLTDEVVDRDTNNPYTRSSSIYRQYNWNRYSETNGYYNVIYSGNYLNYLRDRELGGTPKKQYKMRMDIVIDAAKEVILSNDEPNKRISLMRFSSDNGGGFVDVPIGPIQEIGDTISDKITSYHPAGGTPIAETLYEGNQYLTSGSVDYGTDAEYGLVTGYNRKPSDKNNYKWYSGRYNQTFTESNYPGSDTKFTNYYSTVKTSSDPGSVKGTEYSYPEAGLCGAPNQKVILFSDGQPSGDTGKNKSIQALADSASPYQSDTPNPGCKTYGTGDDTVTTCLPALAWYMNHPKRRQGENLPTLTIDTIGGFLGADSTAGPILDDVASYGGGTYYPVTTQAEIIAAMSESFGGVDESPSTFTAPAIAVSSYNSLQISDELYYAVFKPNDTGAWAGNLKRYRISNKGVVDSAGDLAIGSDGYFLEDAVSFWSDTNDGFEVTDGGVAERFGDQARNIKLLNAAGNLIQATPESVMNLTGDLLGLDAAGLVDSIFDTVDTIGYEPALANWISGLTPNGQNNRLEMEDAIHSRPVVINYTNDRRIVYIGTNSGYLHAFDTANGREVFSLIPQEVLTNARFYMDPDSSSADNKIYGLDGPITYWHNDKNLNGIVDGSDTVYLYVGMRRGGHSYYAFNITNPDSPSLLWQKHGNYLNQDKNIPTVSDGYSRLGQTWSSLKPALVNWNGTDTVVLFAGGGYDPAEDESSEVRLDHTVGNTVYMINAIDGTVLWNAYTDVSEASTEMKNSFASDVTPVDRDGDGYIDLLYAADTGGRVWRFDWKDNNKGFNGGVIADINDSDTAGVSGNRRFYVSPDASYIKTKRTNENDEGVELVTNDSFLLISIGSGYRAHPLDEEVNDQFYLIKDSHGLDYPDSYTKIGVSDLAEWSSSDATDEVKSSYGWYFDPSVVGEKIMSPSITLNGVVTFNTFATGSTDEIEFCSGNLGISRTYQFALSEEIRSRITCHDGGDSCKPDIPGEEPTGGDIVPRLKPDPTLVMPDPEECPEGDVCDPPTCDDYAISILSGTTLTEGNMDRCDLFETNYWEEER